VAEQPAPLYMALRRPGPALVLFATTTLAVLSSAGTTLGYDAVALLLERRHWWAAAIPLLA